MRASATHPYPAPDSLRQRVAPVLGQDVAGRLCLFEDNALYVNALPGRAFLSWLVDALVVWGTAVASAVAYLLSSSAPDAGVGAVVITVVLLLVLPFVYGCCYANGRALGAVLAGTRLVRLRDGGRIGWVRAGGVMLIRVVLLPLGLVGVFAGGGSTGGTVRRTSVDDRATAQLRAAGFRRLG